MTMSMIERGRSVLGEEIVRKILSGGFLALLIKVGSAGLSFLMFLLLARAMGQTEYGIFGAAFSLATLLAVIGSFGQRPAVLRFAALYDEAGEHALRRGVTRTGYIVVTLGCLLSGGIAWAYYRVSQGDPDPALIAAVIAMTLAIGLSEYQSFVLRVTTGVGPALVPRDIVWRAVVCVGAGLVLACSSRVSATEASWFVALSLLAVIGAQFLYHEARSPETRIRGAVAYDLPRWRKPVVGLWLASIIQGSATALSVVLVERFIGPDEAGPFFSAMRTAQLLSLFMLATSVISTPMLSRSLSRGDRRQSQQVCTLTSAISTGFSLVGYVALLLFGEWLLRLFGPGFDAAYPALLVFAFGFMVAAALGPTGPLLEMSGLEKYYFAVLLIYNGIGVLTMLPAIHWFGSVGAAGCTAFASVGWSVGAWVYCRRKLGIDPSFFGALFPPREPETRA